MSPFLPGSFLAGPVLDVTGRAHLHVMAVLDEAWGICYDLIARPPGQLLLIGVRVELAWAAIQNNAAPPRGLTAATLRGVRIGDYVRDLGPLLEAIRRRPQGRALAGGGRTMTAVALRKAGFGFLLDGPATRPARGGQPRGRPRLNDLLLARTAQAYLQALERGSGRPVLDAAARLGEKPERVRDLLHRARRRGLLVGEKNGAAGGALTAPARELLAATKRTTTRRRKR